MPGSPTQKTPSNDEKSSSAGGQATTAASAATTAQEPTVAAGRAQDAQRQATCEAQVGGKSTEQNGRQHDDALGTDQQTNDDGLSQIVGLSQTEGAEEEDSARREAVQAERNSEVPWGIRQFWEDDDNVPVWARPPHASQRAAHKFYKDRAARVIRNVNVYFPLPHQ
ncbi:hypothetical protein ISF_08190 [Cordyceps fumosorosea ARSEF 2679]|uniref:Uncharacterized protein n=1 Tax=Cordyceps fumosorosea (strain ARSEF 2679) TaxID=1081104 RepID=A0A167MYS6_CORFA|nr:hypothetical protein ISF_08190 [Cordyceps fumosorosea ARSEF 2679]OAA54919.1 hypothetical protein ISF_08190 [Cordyceps fumosorosea ARSEF 2679]